MSVMLVEVHTARQPAIPHRALISAILLLALACALAAGMAWRRSGATLGLRVAPDGWGVSFQTPRSFQQAVPTPADGVSALHFIHTVRAGSAATLIVSRIEINPGVTAEEIAALIVTQHHRTRLRRLVRERKSLGPHEAVEISDEQGSIVARVALLPSGHALAFSLSVHGAPLDPHIYRLFDLTCRSVEYD